MPPIIHDSHPLLLPNLKAQYSSGPYLSSTVSVLDGFGNKGARPRPFRQDLAIREFGSWVYKAAMLNAKAFASVPLRLYVRRRGGAATKLYGTRPAPRNRKRYLLGDARERPSRWVLSKIAEFGDDFEEVTEPHPALKLLSTVNDWQNGFELSILRALYWQITGNAYMHPVIDRSLGVPSELWLMPSQWVKVVPDRTGADFIKGYTYGKPPNEKTFAPDEVIQWKLPNLEDPYYGKGWVEALWTALGLHKAKRVMDTAKFENHARPDWLLIVKNGAPGAALDRLEAAIENKLMGPGKAGRFLSVSGDVTAQALNLEVDEVGDAEKVLMEISAVADIPYAKLVGNDPVKANSEIQDVGWLRDTILPYCRMDEDQLNARYLPLFDLGDDAVLAYDNPVPDDEGKAVDIRVKEAGGPYKTYNEVRTEAGEQPLPGGDTVRGQDSGGLLGQLFGAGVKPPADAGSPPDGTAPTAPTVPLSTLTLTGEPPKVADILALQEAYYTQTLPREACIASAMAAFGYDNGRAQALFPVKTPDAPKSPDQIAQEQAQLEALTNSQPAPVEAGDAAPASGGKTHVVVNNHISASDGQRIENLNARATRREGPAGDAAGEPVRQVGEIKAGVGADNGDVQESQARPLPQGAQLVPILRKMFAAQRTAVLGELQGKSLDDVEIQYVSQFHEDQAARLGDPHVLHAWKRATRAKADDSSKLPPHFIPLDRWTNELANEVKPVIEVLMEHDGRALLTRIGASADVFSVVERRIPEAAQNLSLKFSASTNQTTSMQLDEALSQLRDEISAGLVEGDTREELTKRVNNVFDLAERQRADTIARTEASRAAHTGELMTAKASGVVSGKAWLASADACDICDEFAAQGTIPLDQSFGSDDYGVIDSPPGHPRCSCSAKFVTTDDASA